MWVFEWVFGWFGGEGLDISGSGTTYLTKTRYTDQISKTRFSVQVSETRYGN